MFGAYPRRNGVIFVTNPWTSEQFCRDLDEGLPGERRDVRNGFMVPHFDKDIAIEHLRACGWEHGSIMSIYHPCLQRTRVINGNLRDLPDRQKYGDAWGDEDEEIQGDSTATLLRK
jgi:hypothetical protein